MNSAREAILGRLRTRAPELSEERNPVAEAAPEWELPERIARFCRKLESVRAEVHQVGRQEWAERVIALAEAKGLNNLLYGDGGPLGEPIRSARENYSGPLELITREQPIEEWKEALFFQVGGAVTSARAGIAETGSLVIWPDAEEPRSFSLVPPVHFAVLEAGNLYNTFADAVEAGDWQQGMPTNALLISGPSKTADIEQTLAYGVHGPTELVVLLILD